MAKVFHRGVLILQFSSELAAKKGLQLYENGTILEQTVKVKWMEPKVNAYCVA